MSFIQDVIASDLRAAGVPADLLNHSPDETTVVVDLGEGRDALVVGYTDPSHPDHDATNWPGQEVYDWTVYGPDASIKVQDSAPVGAAVRQIAEWATS